jgi:uncharacterized protein with von Willebrand factor type A (vWA) domain
MQQTAPHEDAGKLAHNIAHFARALRKAGLPLGPGQVLDAVRAVALVGFTARMDFYWTLHACLVRRPEHRATFHQVFRLFWRDPRYLDHMMSLMLPALHGTQQDRSPTPSEKRAAEALLDGMIPDLPELPDGETRLDIDAAHSMSAQERLRSLDFEQMSVAEMAQARRMLARLRLPVQPLVTRRARPAAYGPGHDLRASLRAAMRRGGEVASLSRSRPGLRWPALVVICDISGSMAQYSRMVLHFLHAVSNAQKQAGGQGWAQVHGFTFGTRLTNITRHLARRDVDAALASAGAQAQDWSGGTRIGACLRDFNLDWSRRVMGQGAVVLLITDGLDRDDPALLTRQMQRLQRSSHRLIWLNPLLRWDGFAPRASGIRAMLPYVDSFRAGHSIASLEALGAAISDMRDAGEKNRLLAMMRQDRERAHD